MGFKYVTHTLQLPQLHQNLRQFYNLPLFAEHRFKLRQQMTEDGGSKVLTCDRTSEKH